jgi:hypothetical protein
MEQHNKILLAGELLLDAAKIYKSGVNNVDFAKCILLAGAVIGILTPWLEELGEKPSQIQMAETAAQIKGIDLTKITSKKRKEEIGNSIRFYRLIYNSLKHAGQAHAKIASDDLSFEADLKQEASYLMNSAIDDYNKIPFSQNEINTKLPDELLTLLQSNWVD